jgi:hypothetical protein
VPAALAAHFRAKRSSSTSQATHETEIFPDLVGVTPICESLLLAYIFVVFYERIEMNRWFISDTHFSHANIIGYTGRPFQSVSEMNEKLTVNWNALIKPQDIVFFLGDFGLGSTDFLTSPCSRLHGNKICIRGNHNGTPAKMHTVGFTLVLESAFIKIGRHQVELVHIPSQPAPSHF